MPPITSACRRSNNKEQDYLQTGGGKRKRGHGWSSSARKKKRVKGKQPPVIKQLSPSALLASIYFEAGNPGSFGSPRRLLIEARKKRPELQIEQVEKWLNSQPAYTLNRDSKQRFFHRKVIVRGVRIQYQADLVDAAAISPENDGNTFILTVIDCFSRLATAVPIKSKAAQNVLRALQVAFGQLGSSPLKLQTDDGKEFKNSLVQDFLKRHGVKWFSTAQPVKAQIVERFNRTLKSKLQKFYSANQTLRYVEALPKILSGYNSTVHSALKPFAPINVTLANEGKVFEVQYRAYLNKRVKKPKFRIGDIVRISEYRPTFFRKTTQQNFTTELFVIIDVRPTVPTTYKLKSQTVSEAITGSFYEAELQKVEEE
jgi:hypothetical protein